MNGEPSHCSSCGRAIIWTVSPTGARLPLTARPVTVYSLDDSTDPPRAVKRTVVDEPTPGVLKPVKLYISHFVDCPQSSQHSRLHADARG